MSDSTSTTAPAPAKPVRKRTPRAAKPAGIGTAARPHALVAQYMRAMGKTAQLVGARAMPGAGPNARGELLCKLPNLGTVAYLSLAAKGTQLHVTRSTYPHAHTGTPAACAKATKAAVARTAYPAARHML